MTEEERYRFGPLERRGLIAGWRGGQIAVVAAGLGVGVVALHAQPDAAGVAGALLAVGVALAVACWPISGRTGEEWLPTVLRWSVDGWVARHRLVSPAPGEGVLVRGPHAPVSTGRGPARGDRVFAGLSLLAVAPPRAPGSGASPAVGVFHDERAQTYTATLAVRGRSFTLLGGDEKARRIGGWAGVLASLAREHSPVHRVQWLAVTLPDDGRGAADHLAARARLDPGHPAHHSYREVLATAGSSASRHEVLVALQLKADRRARRSTRAGGVGVRGARAAAHSVLLREIEALARQLADTDMTVEGALRPEELAAVVRRTGQAAPVAGLGPLRSVSDGPAPGRGPDPGRSDPQRWPWPMAMEAEWGQVRTDETWHATYWIAEWPRVDVSPDFLAPLLLAPGRRVVTVVMEPISPLRAVRQVEQARTADLADSELRRRGGFLATARRSRESEVVARREAELADGHASFRYSGYVTVTAASRAALRDACDVTEQAAGQSHLELRRLFGDQARGFTCGLPLCRGLS